MKKIFKMLVVLFAVLYMIPAWSYPQCSQQMGNVTGGACSIKELNSLEKSRSSQEKVNLDSKKERNLRPLSLNPEITNVCDVYCVFGMNLRNSLLEK